MYYFIKVIVSAILITLISEISKRSSIAGSILASVPLLSVLSIIWLYLDTKDIKLISRLSIDIFYLVIPSLSFFICLPLLLKKGFGFYISLILSLVIMIVFYFIMMFFLQNLHIIPFQSKE
ncbi:MAG TPA: DUF3147 family protein [Candidatus Cloacimonadota bacterium]|nr:DUF3147 family protein [Candidatus Cloacimonadota bacterium]HOD54411.1 DUF3147 family protein [Candidatus Cloacimonadota bacterium]